jgi:hypothetical protein
MEDKNHVVKTVKEVQYVHMKNENHTVKTVKEVKYVHMIE